MEGQQRAGRGDANGRPLFEHSRSFRRPKKPSLSQMMLFQERETPTRWSGSLEMHTQGGLVLRACSLKAWGRVSGHADRRKRVPTSHSVCQSCQRDNLHLPRQSFKEDKVYIMYERKWPNACEEMLDDIPIALTTALTDRPPPPTLSRTDPQGAGELPHVLANKDSNSAFHKPGCPHESGRQPCLFQAQESEWRTHIAS